MVELEDGLSEEEYLSILETELAEKDKRIAELKKEVNITRAGNNALAKLARGKTEKIKEIDHRVKNDFQAVASMLNMQAKKTESDETAWALEEARDRVYTIAYVYEQLQLAEGQVSMRELATEIVSRYGFAGNGVSASIGIPEDMIFPAEQAIPCGWILNELLCNASKHAFPDGRKGEVIVAMGFDRLSQLIVKENGDYARAVELVVSDDGVGLPEDFDPYELESMGMEIVSSLVEQLDGRMKVDDGDEVKFTIRFEI